MQKLVTNGLSNRLFRLVFSCYLGFAVLLTTFQIYYEYQRARKDLGQRLRIASEAFSGSLETAIWRLDFTWLQAAISSSIKADLYDGIVILDANQKIFFAEGLIDREHMGELVLSEHPMSGNKQGQWRFAEGLLSIDNKLFEPKESMGEQSIGTVYFYTRSDRAFAMIQNSVAIMIVNALLKTAALWLIFLMFAQKLVQRPLKALRDKATTTDFNAIEPVPGSLQSHTTIFSSVLGERDPDELTELAQAFDAALEALLTKQARIRYKEREKRILLETIQGGICKLGHTGKILSTNAAMGRMLQEKEDKIVGTFLGDWLAKDHVNLLKLALQETVMTESPSWLELKCVDKAGDEHTIVLQLGLVVQEDRDYYFIAEVRDVTEQKKMTTNINMLHEQLAIAEKLSKVGELTGAIVHDIRNPLSVIHGYNHRMLETAKELENVDAKNHQKLISNIEKTNRAANAIEDIINNILGFIRNDTKDPIKRVSLAEILKTSLDFCKDKLHGTKIQVRNLVAGGDYEIACHKSQIVQVFVNLIENATDAISPVDEKWIQIEAVEKNGVLSIRVTDSGEGVNEQDITRIFEPMFTTKKEKKGTGLGLSISQRIVNGHGGRLYYDSTGANTSFVLELPREEPNPAKEISL